MKEPQTLWEQELFDKKQNKKNEKKLAEIDKYRKLIGREVVPRIVQGGKIKSYENISAADLLKSGGYVQKWNKSWTRRFNIEYQYHAYVLEDGTIEIHTDKFMKNAAGIPYHLSSTFMVKEEKKRLKKFIPLPVVQKDKKKSIIEVRKFRDEILPRDIMIQKLKELKEKNG